MWKCKHCGEEILADCYYDRGPILTGINKYGQADENKIYEIDLSINIYFCPNCDEESEVLTDIAYWEE